MISLRLGIKVFCDSSGTSLGTDLQHAYELSETSEFDLWFIAEV